MNDSRSTDPRTVPAAGADDAVIQLLRGSDPRELVPPDVLERSWNLTHGAWRETVVRRRRHRAGWLALAAAAVVGLVVGGGLMPGLTRWAGGLFGPEEPVAVLEVVAGSATAELTRGARLEAGAEIATEADGRAAFRLAGGQSLRVDAGSRVRWLSDRVVELERGAVYVDSQPNRDGTDPEPIEIRTPHGSVTHVGTQFEVRLDEGALRVRVREGRVKIDQGSRTVDAAAGSEWTLHDGGRVSRRPVAAHGEAWRGYLEIAPPFELEGRSLRDFLHWVARETGWRLAYADPAVELSAPEIILHGSLTGVAADRAHEMVLETCGLQARLEDGILLIEHRTTR